MLGNNLRSKQAPPRLDRPPPLDVQRHALFLDLDGTLLEIARRPDLARADDVLKGLLRELHARLDGALAIVSGRAISDIDRILGAPALQISGAHGQEHRIGDVVTRPPASPQLDAAANRMRQLNAGDLLKVVIEHKGSAVAIHYREAPEHARLVRRAAEEVAQKHGLKVMHGRMVVEFLPPHASKSDAVTLFMNTPPFQDRLPIAIGDDTTDEHAFSAAQRFGGYGVQVGEARPTLATYRLASVSAVRSWLLSSLGRAIT